MIRFFPILLMAWMVAGALSAASVFEEANQQFAAGDFAAAASGYQLILAEKGPDAAVYYNLGNTFQSMKRYGPAILAYERARLLTPRDPDLISNLALARKAVAAFEEPERHPGLDAAISYLSLNEWSWLVAGSAVILAVLALLKGLGGLRVRWMRQVGGVLSIGAGLALLAGSAALILRMGEDSRGIVLSEDAAVRLSPFEKAESLGTAGQGRIVKLGKKEGDFQYIEVPGAGLKGWTANADVEAVIRD